MATRRTSRPTARRRPHLAHSRSAQSLYRRQLRFEPLEDRRLLALVTVTTLDDSVNLNDGLTSLREAIFATNLVAGADTIGFATGLTSNGPAKILLTQGELKITDSLTINGPGANVLTIDASGNDPTPTTNNGDGSRIFNIDNGIPDSSIDVSIIGLTLTGGDTAGDGGAILTAETTSITDIHVSNNAGMTGGGVAVIRGSALISHGVMYNNVARSGVTSNGVVGGGGGVFVQSGELSIANSTLSGNRAILYGGGLIARYSNVTLRDTTISNNFADREGGGINVLHGSASLVRCNILDNSLDFTRGSEGAGVRINAGLMEVIDSVVAGNQSARIGGGIDAIFAQLHITGTTIAHNASRSTGGGVGANMSIVTIENSTITGNTAHAGGGGIFSYGPQTALDIRNSTITQNNYEGINAGFGNQVLLDHVIVAGNVRDLRAPTNTLTVRFSLIGMFGLSEAPISAPDANGNLVGGLIHGAIDPLLGPLADNGGPTMTHALLPGSPAINAGDLSAQAGVDGVPLYDQRGEPFGRVFGGRIDIGAFEYQESSDLNLLVDTLVDESDNNYSRGDLSLREAIELANLWPSTDTIRFDPALTAAGPATILLTKGELKITDDVTITGPGANLLTVDAGGNDLTPTTNNGDGSRIFNIDDGTANQIEVALTGLTLTGGDSSGSGGAVFSSERLTITESKVSGNHSSAVSPSSRAGGGGVYSRDGVLTIESSQFLDNSARAGAGAINAFNVDLNILDGHISNNSGPSAGGVNVQDGSAAFARVTITGNSVASAGVVSAAGGLRIFNADLSMSECDISHNSRGAGIVCSGGEFVSIDRSSISDNASCGLVLRVGSGGVALIADSVISGNIGGSLFGGGIDARASEDGTITLTRTEVSYNSSYYRGGGMLFRIDPMSKLTITESAIHDNRLLTPELGAQGGGMGIANNSGEVLIRDSRIYNNSSRGQGGAISFGGTLTIDGCTITGNTARSNGGAIFNSISGAQVGSLTLRNSAVSHNTASSGGGIGLIGTLGSAAPVHSIFRSTIADNSAIGNVVWNDVRGVGGGVFMRNGILSVVDSTVVQNMAVSVGGGISTGAPVVPMNPTARIDVVGATIAGNTATQGGGLFLTGTTTVSHSTIASNAASDVGGGVFLAARSLALNHAIVATNVGLNHPDISIASSATATSQFSLIGDNTGSTVVEAPRLARCQRQSHRRTGERTNRSGSATARRLRWTDSNFCASTR